MELGRYSRKRSFIGASSQGLYLFHTPTYAKATHTLDGQLRRLNQGDALIDSYIDDILGVFAEWQKQDISDLYKFTVSIFESAGLPRHPAKSLPLDAVETSLITFTGWIWDLDLSLVYPAPDKVSKLQRSIADIDRLSISVRTLLSLTGKTIWFSLVQRPLLALLDSIFRYSEESLLDKPAYPSEGDMSELQQLSRLLPLACIDLRASWSPIIIATDASTVAGAVVYCETSPSTARLLYDFFLRAVPKGNLPPDPATAEGSAYICALRRVITSATWTTAFVHKWKYEEHISGLEASIIALSMQWAASKGLTSTNVVWLTDSASSLGAFVKGRSSVRSILARCRKVAAICIAHNLFPRVCFVPTELNPADGPSRPHG